jgi:hypothetical protein
MVGVKSRPNAIDATAPIVRRVFGNSVLGGFCYRADPDFRGTAGGPILPRTETAELSEGQTRLYQ